MSCPAVVRTQPRDLALPGPHTLLIAHNWDVLSAHIEDSPGHLGNLPLYPATYIDNMTKGLWALRYSNKGLYGVRHVIEISCGL